MRILVVGASARALAQSVRAAGHEPVAVDYFGDRDLRETCPALALGRDLGLAGRPAAFLRAVALLRARGYRWEAVAYTGGLENAPRVVEGLAQGARLLGNGPRALRAARDWPRLAGELARAGFPVPQTLRRGERVPARGAWLLKPRRGAGGAGVRRAAPGEVVPPGYLAQAYVPGTPGSAVFLADGRRALLLALTEQLVGCPELGAPGFRYAGNLLLPPDRVRGRPAAALAERLVNAVTAACGLRGLGGVDFILTADGPVPVEVNPRPTAAVELLEAALGRSLFPAHVAAVRGRLPRGVPRWEGCWGKAVVYATGPGTWQFAGDWRAQGLRDVPAPGTPLAAGQPVCTVLARAPGPESCRMALADRVAEVRREFVGADASSHPRPHVAPGRGGQPGQGDGGVPGSHGNHRDLCRGPAGHRL